jgi:long-chain acyl-CoA synthetase
MNYSLQEATRISHIPRYWATATPDAVALHEPDQQRTVTYGALWAAVEAAARLLRDNGVQAGDRIMLVSENCAAQIALLFAAAELQAWPVIVNARLSEREIDVIRAHCVPRVLLFTTGISSDACVHAARYRALDTDIGGLGTVAISAPDAAAVAEAADLAADVAAMIYTSGTTGTPKGVMMRHAGLLHFAQVSSTSRNMEPRDVAHAVLPISHIFGLATVLLATMYAGASLYLQARFTAEETLRALAEGKLTILQGVPTMFTRLLKLINERGGKAPAPTLRYLYTGGAPLDPTLKRDVEAVFSLPLHHGYGMTEYAGSLFITRFDRPRSDCSAGEIVAGAELRIVDEHGADQPPGVPGQLWVRGPGTMLGYYHAPDQTAQALLPGGWLNTGDIGRSDPDGALFVVGRTKDLIICSGFNVYPIEVESVINSFPGIRLSAVVGRPIQNCDEEVVAFVETDGSVPFEEAALHAFLKTRLSPYKRPAAIREIEAIPTTASGKLLKQGLKQLALDA